MGRRIPGEFVPCDVNLASDEGILGAGPWAELLYRRALEHAKKTARDGEIYAVELPAIAIGIPSPKRQADALVRENLWIILPNGWRIRSWAKWNLSRNEQEEERKKKQIAAVFGNHQRHHKHARSPECPHCKDAQ